MRFEAVIFDLDGTLLDSMDVWEKIDICFLQKRGLPVPADYVTEICARSFEEAAQYTIDLFGLSEKSEDIIREWNEMAVYEYAHHVKLSPYALEYLIELKKRGVKLAVATGLPGEFHLQAVHILRQFFLGKFAFRHGCREHKFFLFCQSVVLGVIHTVFLLGFELFFIGCIKRLPG